jgi:hypothetical protein
MSPAVGSIPSSQRHLRIFVSSTFRDMQEEREELVKKVYPQLRHYCMQRGVFLRLIDLRWGITAEQAEAERVIPICLHEIDRCRPFFVCLLGERYGWVPPRVPPAVAGEFPWLSRRPGISVTEMEIRHGALNDPGAATHSLFYLRHPDYVPPSSAGTADRVEIDPTRLARLRSLKTEIRASSLPCVDNYVSPRDVATRLLTDLESRIEALFPVQPLVERKRTIVWQENLGNPALPKGTPQHTWEELRLKENTFADSLRTFFIGRDRELARLDAFAAGEESALAMIGAEGSGKSALLARWTSDYAAAHPETCVVTRYLGHPTVDFDHALLRTAWDLNERLKLGETIHLQAHGAPVLKPLLGEAAKVCTVLIVLDGVDHLARPHAADLEQLVTDLPTRIRIIYSVRPDSSVGRVHRTPAELVLGGFTHGEQRRTIIEYLALDGKTLGDAQLVRLLARPGIDNPAQLRMLLDELRMFGQFDALDAVIDSHSHDTDERALYQRVLDRLEVDFAERPGDPVATLFRSLACARTQTLREEELEELLELSALDWAELFFAVRDLLMQRGSGLAFRSDDLTRTIERRYLTQPGQRAATHIRLARYFRSTSTRSRDDEVAYHLFRAERWSELRLLLLDGDRQVTFAREDLLAYWATLREHYDPEEDYLALAGRLAERGSSAAHSLLAIGRFLVAAGYTRAGKLVLEQCASIAGHNGDDTRWLGSMALDDLALLLMSEGRGAEALEVAGRSVALREDAYALTMLGTFEVRQGRFDEAERHLARARQLAEEATYPNEELLAIIALAMQRLHEARGA